MQCVNLTDDELWRAIAANTEAMSELLHKRAELDTQISITTEPVRRSGLISAYLGMVNKFESEFRAYTTELRRRYCA
jgi:hypothetical protein